jgi:multiple sugar transport system permease protein
LPFFLLFAVFILYPFFQGVFMSFTDWSVSSRGSVNFVGLDNYTLILSGKGTTSVRFLNSVKNLVIYVPLTLSIGLSLSLALALITRQLSRKLFSVFRGIYFVPYVLPLFLCAGIWQWFMTTGTGLVASALANIGIGRGITWDSTKYYAIIYVMMVDIWNSAGFNFVIISAGMADISPDLYEAAEIDGASTFQKMTKITIPLLEPILFFVITYGFISALQVYDIPWIISNGSDINSVGGPGQVMSFPVMEMVRNIYLGGKSGLGRACAEGVSLMTVILAVTAIQFKARRKKV